MVGILSPPKTNMTGWNIHHEWNFQMYESHFSMVEFSSLEKCQQIWEVCSWHLLEQIVGTYFFKCPEALNKNPRG